MKQYEVEFIRTSYIVCTVEAENRDDAKDAAWRWFEGCGDGDDACVDIVYCKELTE